MHTLPDLSRSHTDVCVQTVAPWTQRLQKLQWPQRWNPQTHQQTDLLEENWELGSWKQPNSIDEYVWAKWEHLQGQQK